MRGEDSTAQEKGLLPQFDGREKVVWGCVEGFPPSSLIRPCLMGLSFPFFKIRKYELGVIRDLYTVVELRPNLSFEKKKKNLQIWRKKFLHFLGNWAADRTMNPVPYRLYPKFFCLRRHFSFFAPQKRVR